MCFLPVDKTSVFKNVSQVESMAKLPLRIHSSDTFRCVYLTKHMPTSDQNQIFFFFNLNNESFAGRIRLLVLSFNIQAVIDLFRITEKTHY